MAVKGAASGLQRRGRNPQQQKRETLRKELWPGSSAWVWDPADRDTVGYFVVPRVMPLVLCVIRRRLAEKASWKKAGDPTSAYVDLWSRDYGQGVVTVTDEADCAFCSGYTSTRAVRTWRSHMQTLVEQGFVMAMRDGLREYGHILLLNPLAVCKGLREQNKITDDIWGAFVRRAAEVKAVIPPPLDLAKREEVIIDDEV